MVAHKAKPQDHRCVRGSGRTLALTIAISNGLDHAIDRLAAAGGADRRFLTRAWYLSSTPRLGQAVTITVTDNARGDIAAIPLVPRGRWVREVPGRYWPFRSFPVVSAVESRDLRAVLSSRAARRALGPIFRIGPVPEDDPALAALRAGARRSGYRLIERTIGRCFVQDLAALRAAGPWPHDSAVKRNARRERQLGAHGPLRWRIVHGGDWEPALFDKLATIERASWLAKEGADLKFADPEKREQWVRLAADPVIGAMMSLCLLSVGERPVAFSFDLDVGDTRYGITTGYDQAFHQQSPGRLVHYRAVGDALERGLSWINWGLGDSGYKRELGAVPGPLLVDCLAVRNVAGLPQLVRRFWRGAPR
jgi:hypothetical protein